MPQIKVLQIGPLYHQLRAFPHILTLTLVKMFENAQKTQMLQKNRVTVPPWYLHRPLLLGPCNTGGISRNFIL